MTVDEIIAAVASEGLSSAEALALINERYYEANAKARYNRVTETLGTTVAGTTNYALTDAIIDVDRIRIGTAEYAPASQEQIAGLYSGRLTFRRSTGVSGVFAPDYTAAGVVQIEVYPAPETTGDTIYVEGVEAPTALVAGSGTPIFPADLHGKILVDGTIALVRARTDERLDTAQWFEQRFVEGVEELRRRAIGRTRAAGPVQIQLQIP